MDRYNVVIDGRVHTYGLSLAEVGEYIVGLQYDVTTNIRKLVSKGRLTVKDDIGPVTFTAST